MNNSLSTLAYLFIGYLCGVILAPDIFSANFTHTHWLNVWTYAWLFGWPIMLVIHFFAPLLLKPTIIVVKP